MLRGSYCTSLTWRTETSCSTATVENGNYIHYDFSVVDVSFPHMQQHFRPGPHIPSDLSSCSKLKITWGFALLSPDHRAWLIHVVLLKLCWIKCPMLLLYTKVKGLPYMFNVWERDVLLVAALCFEGCRQKEIHCSSRFTEMSAQISLVHSHYFWC